MSDTPTPEAPTPQLVREAQFQMQGVSWRFMMYRVNAAKHIFEVAYSKRTDGPEFQRTIISKDAPKHFLDEIVTFMANRFQVQLMLAEKPPEETPPPPSKKLEIVKEMPK